MRHEGACITRCRLNVNIIRPRQAATTRTLLMTKAIGQTLTSSMASI